MEVMLGRARYAGVGGLQMIRAKYDSRRMIRATGDDSRNSMDVSRKQAAMSCFFQIKI